MGRRRTNLWAGVALAAIGALFVIILYVVIPDGEPQARMVLLGLVVLAGQGAVIRFLTGHVSRETRRIRERPGNVSRETSRPTGKERP